MISVIIGTNRPGSSTAQVARQVAGLYQELGVPLALLDLAQLPPEIFQPSAYAEKPRSFEPFAHAVMKSAGLVVIAPEYNGGLPGVLKYFIDMLKYPESLDLRPSCFIGLSAGIWGGRGPVEQLQQIFSYRNAYIYPERIFLARVHDLQDDHGQLTDPEALRRLKSQAMGFIDFVERLRGITLRTIQPQPSS